jgi:hypothetical protein
MEEKEWSEPELVVLVRSKPEESVLVSCKHPGEDWVESNYGNISCQLQFGDCEDFFPCLGQLRADQASLSPELSGQQRKGNLGALRCKPLILKGYMGEKESSPGGTRTPDTRIRNPLLYPY